MFPTSDEHASIEADQPRRNNYFILPISCSRQPGSVMDPASDYFFGCIGLCYMLIVLIFIIGVVYSLKAYNTL